MTTARGSIPLPLIGLALYVIGYVGVFFGNLIKAAVSRQREFLADASAVQFTRNPDGIAGALKKIGALAEGSAHCRTPTPRKRATCSSARPWEASTSFSGCWRPTLRWSSGSGGSIPRSRATFRRSGWIDSQDEARDAQRSSRRTAPGRDGAHRGGGRRERRDASIRPTSTMPPT